MRQVITALTAAALLLLGAPMASAATPMTPEQPALEAVTLKTDGTRPTELRVKAGTSRALVKFRIPDAPTEGAKVSMVRVRLRVHPSSVSKLGDRVIFWKAPNTWDEDTVTWQTRPPRIGPWNRGASMRKSALTPYDTVGFVDFASNMGDIQPGSEVSFYVVADAVNGTRQAVFYDDEGSNVPTLSVSFTEE